MKSLVLIAASMLLASCGGNTVPGEFELVRACDGGVKVFRHSATGELQFSSALSAGKVASDVDLNDICESK